MAVNGSNKEGAIGTLTSTPKAAVTTAGIGSCVVVKDNKYHIANMKNYPSFTNTRNIADVKPGEKLIVKDVSNNKLWLKVAVKDGSEMKEGWIWHDSVKADSTINLVASLS